MPNALGRLVTWAERERFTLLTGVAFLVGVAALRVGLEKVLLGADGITPLFRIELMRQYTGAYLGVPGGTFLFLDSLWKWAHDIGFFIAAFAGGAFILQVFSRRAPRRLLNAMLVAWPVILLSPFLDRFVFAAVPATWGCLDAFGVLGPTNSIAC